jgi:hypothetical protein
MLKKIRLRSPKLLKMWFKGFTTCKQIKELNKESYTEDTEMFKMPENLLRKATNKNIEGTWMR